MAKAAKGARVGRNKDKCERYRSRGTREANKARREAKREYTFAKRRAARARHLRILDAVRRDWEEAEPLDAA